MMTPRTKPNFTTTTTTTTATTGYLKQVLAYLDKKKPSKILAQRMFKSIVNTTVALILCLNHKTLSILGGAPAMLPLISVIVHPGRRVGTMFEATMFCTTGLLLGNAYALFSRFIAQKILGELWYLPDEDQLHRNYYNYRAALAWLAVMQVLMLFFHGWIRSITHKFFAIAFPLFLVVHFAFSDNIHVDAATIVQNYTIPFFLGIAIGWVCNLLIFPEFGSSYLGSSITDSLNELQRTIDSTIQFFITVKLGEDGTGYLTKPATLAQLTKLKTSLRSKLNSTQGVLQECTYEISLSYLSPMQLKPIIVLFKSQLSSISALINASQLELTMLLQPEQSQLLQDVLQRTKIPIFNLHQVMSQSLYIIKLAIAHSYDVKLSKVQKSTNLLNQDIELSEIQLKEKINDLAQSMAIFEVTFRQELQYLTISDEHYDQYLSPNDDMFLLSSFLMNLKETASSICNMMRETQVIYELRREKEKKGILGQRLWFSFLTSTDHLKGWFVANSNVNIVNQADNVSLNGDTSTRIFIQEPSKESPKNEDQPHKPTQPPVLHVSHPPRLSTYYHNVMKAWISFCDGHRDHFRFGFQIAFGLTLATFPMFVPEARHWFYDLRGTWIGFICILVLEPQMGGTFFVFFLRFVGVILGSAWGYLSYVAGGKDQGNPYLQVVITVIGAIPGFYYFLGTPYVKAAIIGIISVYVVMLSSILPSSVGGSILVNFGKRCLAMIYGGAVALVCQLFFFPVKARDELTNEVSNAAGNVSKLFLLYATGLDGEKTDGSLVMSHKRYEKFKELSELTKSSLLKADAFRNEAKREPRLKGSFHEGSKVFSEIIFILREIIDRLDNIILLRRTYGSAIIEDFNDEVHPYRRQLTASMNNCLKAVQLALITKNPLPQYIPSPKIAQRRLIEKIRSLLQAKFAKPQKQRRFKPSFYDDDDDDDEDSSSSDDDEIMMTFHDRSRNKAQMKLLKEKFLSWNATSSSLEEIIQYIEELMELTKLLVGVYEFKYGFLSRSIYKDYKKEASEGYRKIVVNMERGLSQQVPPVLKDQIDDVGTKNEMTEEEVNASASLHSQAISESDTEGDNDSSPVDQNPTAFYQDNTDAISNKTVDTGISHGFRKRLYSVGSWAGARNNNDLVSTKSLGDNMDLGSDEFDSSDLGSDDENYGLPLALKRVVSKKINDNVSMISGKSGKSGKDTEEK